ncbi:hypothetical protein F4777DRAFT_593369 [Nemania sp. FL0916]|nr:hypothetical protein F4777DRAFT_593369 [Nemania sp. FL0916]
MTGNSPRVRATADLDPVSPSPLHPPSPIIVPTLQDQADAYFDMSRITGNPAMLAVPAAISTAGVVIPGVGDRPIIHDNNQNSTPNAISSDVRSTDSNKAINRVAETEESASGGDSTEDMQEPETSRSDATGAEQDVSKSNEFTANSDTTALVSRLADNTAPAHEPISTITQTPNDLSPSFVPNLSHKPLEDSWSPPDTTSSNAHEAQLAQSSGEQVPMINNHYSTSSHSNQPGANIQTPTDNVTTHITKVDANAASIYVPEGNTSSHMLPQKSLLPTKPPIPDSNTAQLYAAASGYSASLTGASGFDSVPLPLSNGSAPNPYQGAVPGTYMGAAPGTFNPYAGATAIPGVNPIFQQSVPASQSDYTYIPSPIDQPPPSDFTKQRWDSFLQEERKYVSEAKWDRFPEGSRIFIGNLSSERVSKKEVFNIFSEYGRLAQISLKQAYGFVQYHTVAEGQAAMDNLQGVEVRGKKINLEISRAQKKDGDGNRGNRGKRDNDRQDNNRGRRDDYRPPRQSSPRRSSQRDAPLYDGIDRDRGYPDSSYSRDRRRSQSPGYGGRDSYRRRSVSPYRRYSPRPEPDLRRRHGADVPDVQFLLLQDVTREFVSWVQSAFLQQGLRVDVMFLNPQMARDAVIQHQIREGVHAVVELDLRAQDHGRLSLQVFDRSAGYDNVRFDQYQDLEPPIAAQIVLQAKSRSSMPPVAYHNAIYPPAPHYSTSTQSHYVPPIPPHPSYPPPTAGGGGPPPLDSAAIHRILGSLNGQQGGPQNYTGGPPVDFNALLTTIGAGPRETNGGPPQRNMSYAHSPPNGAPAVPRGGNSARHVEDIMTQLARYR